MNRLKMKTTTTLLIAIFMISVFAVAIPVFAKHTELTIGFYETSTRYYPDGEVWYDADTPELYIIDFVKTGNAYHKVGHGVPAMDYVDEDSPYIWYHTYLPDLAGSPVVVANGKMMAMMKYTSLYSGLLIEEHFKGTLAIDDDAGTMSGTYTQDAYAYDTDEVTVLEKYPNSVPTDEEGKWYIGHTVYTATAFSPLGDWVFTYDGSWHHDMMITTLNLDGSFSGTGGYPSDADPYPVPWTVTGEVSGGEIDFTIVYGSGYTVWAEGTITPPDMSGTATTSIGQSGTWTATR